MVIREPVQTLNLDRQEHTRVSKIKSLDRGTATREKQESRKTLNWGAGWERT